jgi:FkbM family methyltransferase
MLKRYLVSGANRVLKSTVGVELIRYDSSNSAEHRLKLALDTFGINLIFDIGANDGEYGYLLYKSGYTGELVSFEPMAAPYTKLKSLAARYRGWQVAPRCAVGETSGEIEINVSQNSFSSSILPMLKSHSDAAPQSVYLGKEKLLKTLDELAPQWLTPQKKLFLKIDTQGYEAHVLAGATQTLRQAQGLYLEMSLVPLYEGQVLFDELLDRIRSYGFTLWSIEPEFADPRTGRLLQVNGVFFRQ